MKNSLEIGDSREDGRHKADGSDARLVALSHGCEASLYAHGLVHVGTEWLIKRVDRPRHGDFLHLAEQVKVAQHEVALCTNEYLRIAVFEFLKQFTCPAVLCFFRIISIGHRSNNHPLSGIFLRIHDSRPMLHVQESAPFFLMSCEALHE